MSQLRKLADKGYLTFERDGNAYVYQAARQPQEVRFSLLSGILKKVFKGSAVDLVANLVSHEDLSESELEEIRRIIDITQATSSTPSETGTRVGRAAAVRQEGRSYRTEANDD
jgi:predicted transcriptional regulator